MKMPEKQKVFWCFQGVYNGSINQKCVNLKLHILTYIETTRAQILTFF